MSIHYRRFFHKRKVPFPYISGKITWYLAKGKKKLDVVRILAKNFNILKTFPAGMKPLVS
jgi:hypothetical protein